MTCYLSMAIDCCPKAKSVPDALARMVERRSVLASTQGGGVAACRDSHHARGECVFHLRLGEVFAQINKTAEELWAGQPGTGAVWDWGGGRHYVQPVQYFEGVVKRLPPGTRVAVLLGKVDSLTTSNATTFPFKTPAAAVAASHAYLHLLQHWLTQQELGVRIHDPADPAHTPLHHRADCDFMYMSTAPCFIPSGGGFGRLAAGIVEGRGHTVIK